MKLEIILGILFDLLSKKVVSASYLAEKYGVSSRSIYRYISCLESSGVPLYSIRGNNGGFAVVDTYKLSSTFMSAKEFDAVLNALTAICSQVPDKTLESAITKLKATVKNEFDRLNLKSGNLIIDGSPWGDSNENKAKLKILQKCIDENIKLDISYHDRNGENSQRTIEPYILIFKQGIWYVYAFCNLRKDFRLFKTGRIEKATCLTEKFIRQQLDEKRLSLSLKFENVLMDTVTLKIKKQSLYAVEEWLGTETVIKEKDGSYTATASLPIDEGLISKIMSYGSGIKVISPNYLAKQIKDSAESLLKVYK